MTPDPVPPQLWLISRPELNLTGLYDFIVEEGLNKLGVPSLIDVSSLDTCSHGEILAEIGGRIDYWSFDADLRRPGGARAYFKNTVELGHNNIIELPHWVTIWRLSQGVARELLRYRTAERSQASSRYIEYDQRPTILLPELWRAHETARLAQLRHVHEQQWRESYRATLEEHLLSGRAQGYKGTELRKYARSLAADCLPFSVSTWVVLATNANTIRNILLQRANRHAHPQFRFLAVQLYRLMQQELGNVLQDLEEVVDRDGLPSVHRVPQAKS